MMGSKLPLVTPAVHAVQSAAHMSPEEPIKQTRTADEVDSEKAAATEGAGEQDKEAMLSKLVPDIFARIQRRLQRENDRFGTPLV